jgi:hypothetical protein
MSAALVVQCVQAKSAAQQQEQAKPGAARETAVELAFYRKYTEGMLRRYLYRSMEIGRVPTLLGDFSFRGRATHKKGYTFEDSVIFVHDVERCLTRLNAVERELVKRLALQEYTLAETAALTGMSIRTVGRRYADALDRLTEVFLRLKLMQTPASY